MKTGEFDAWNTSAEYANDELESNEIDNRSRNYSNLIKSNSNGTGKSTKLPFLKHSTLSSIEPSVRPLVADKKVEMNKNKEYLLKRHQQNNEYFKKI